MGKPSPEIFLEVVKLLNAEPSSCLVINDSLMGDQQNGDQQNGDQGQQLDSLATAAGPKQKNVRSDTKLSSFMGKSKPKENVDWDDSGKPSCKNQTKYSDVIGVLLKQSRRFKWHKHWDVQDDEDKDWLWDELKDLFVVDDCRKSASLSIAAGIFRNKKGQWKRKHYKINNTHAQNLADRPKGLTEGEWKDLVKHWDGEEHRKLSAKNVRSRTQQKAKHTMGRKNYARCKAELAQENGGNPPTDGDMFVQTRLNKKSGKALDPISQGFIAQMREQSGLDEDGLDADGNKKPISDEVFVNVVPTCRKKRVRAERHLTYSSSRIINEDLEREKKERDEEFKRLLSEQNAAWERRMKAQEDEYNMRQNQMMEYFRLGRPDLFTRPAQLPGPSDHLFMNYRPGGQPHRPWDQPFRPLERPYRSEEQLFQPGDQPYIPGDQLNRPQNDSGTNGLGTDVLDWFPTPFESGSSVQRERMS